MTFCLGMVEFDCCGVKNELDDHEKNLKTYSYINEIIAINYVHVYSYRFVHTFNDSQGVLFNVS